MVRAVAFVPGSPLLVPGLGGAADVLAELRETCLAAVRSIGPGPLVVLGPGTYPPGSAPRRDPAADLLSLVGGRPLAAQDRAASALPTGLAVGCWLARAAGHESPLAVGAAGSASAVADGAVPGGAALLVVADGSARRGPQAPLPADERAEPWDDALAAALAAGHLEVDLGLGAELGASTDAWRAAAMLTSDRSWDARLLADTAPLGVAYLVATWT